MSLYSVLSEERWVQSKLSDTKKAALVCFDVTPSAARILTSSPASGPYDEIIFLPGYFDSPVTSKSYPRITTIYVSTEASVKNGR